MHQQPPKRLNFLLNGEPYEVAEDATVLDLLTGLGRDPRSVAVERNGELLPRASYAATRLLAGDRLEVVHFVQGGSGKGRFAAASVRAGEMQPVRGRFYGDAGNGGSARGGPRTRDSRKCPRLSAGGFIEYDPGCKGR